MLPLLPALLPLVEAAAGSEKGPTGGDAAMPCVGLGFALENDVKSLLGLQPSSDEEADVQKEKEKGRQGQSSKSHAFITRQSRCRQSAGQ